MNIIKPRVELLPNPSTGRPYTKEEGLQIVKHLELCARNCYKSEDKITDESANRMIRSLLMRKHESPVEHVSISVRFICDRGVSHEIVRHRLASYSQESTRYVNYSGDKAGGEITYIDLAGGLAYDFNMSQLPPEMTDAIYEEWLKANEDAEKHYMKLIELGATPQIARSVLNNSTKTDLIMSANPREWRNFFSLRCDLASHPQMREVARELLQVMYNIFGVIFEDLYEKYFCIKEGAE